jgi:hypothetical protein
MRPKGSFFSDNSKRSQIFQQRFPETGHPLERAAYSDPEDPRVAPVGKHPRAFQGDIKRAVALANPFHIPAYPTQIVFMDVSHENHGEVNIVHLDPPYIKRKSFHAFGDMGNN